MSSLSILFTFIYVFISSVLSFPIKLIVPTPSQTLYPLIFDYEGQLTLLTTQGVYNITKDSSGNYNLITENDVFDSRFHLDIAIDKVHKVETFESKWLYFFPNIKGKTLVKYAYKKTHELNAKVMTHRTISDVTHRKFGFFTGITHNKPVNPRKWNGTIYMYDVVNFWDYVNGTLEQYTGVQEMFSCRDIKPIDRIECLFTGDALYVVEFTADTNYDFYFLTPSLVIPLEDQYNGVKFDYLNNTLVGVIWKDSYTTLMSFVITLSMNAGKPQMSFSMPTDLRCYDLDSLEVLSILDYKYTIVCCYNGAETICDAFDNYLVSLELSTFRHTHLSQLRMTYNNISLTFTAADPLNTSLVYYYESPLYFCVNKEYRIERDPIIIDISSVLNPSPGDLNNESGIYIYSSREMNGTFEEIDENNNVVGEVIVGNENYLYKRIKYTPFNLKRTVISFKAFFHIFGDFHLPTSICELVFEGSCYETCKSCSWGGNEKEHLCNECNEGSYFIEGTQNCYHAIPKHYFFDMETQLFKKCPLNCEICFDGSSCALCNEGFFILSEITKNNSDIDCVKNCNYEKYKWYINEINGNKDLICLNEDTNYCPSEYSCLNKNTNQCINMNDNKDICKHIVPPNEKPSKIFPYLKDNILSYYKESFIDIQQNQTITVYDTTQNANEKYGVNNLTNIDLGECSSKLKQENHIPQDEPLIIAQIDTVEHNYPVNSVHFLIFDQNGNTLNFSVCDHIEINITYPPSHNPAHFINEQQLEMYYEENINIFNSSDIFFNDVCTPYSTFHNGNTLDVPLQIRREEFYVNVNFCDETQCKLTSLNDTGNNIKCKCIIERENLSQEVIEFSSKKDTNTKWKKLTFMNIGLFQCYHLLFKSSLLKVNSGFYIMTIILFIQIINIIVYLCLKEDIFERFVTHDANWNKKKPKWNPPKNEKKLQKKEPDSGSLKNINNSQEKGSDSANLFPFNFNKLGNIDSINTKQLSNLNEKKELFNNLDLSNSNSNFIFNALSLKHAVASNKETFLSLYILRLKQTHPLYLLVKKANGNYFRNISISLFMFQICSNCFLNALFYTDHYMIRNYKKGYNVLYEIPKSILTMVISFALNIICGIFGIKEIKLTKQQREYIQENNIHSKKQSVYFIRMVKVRQFHIIYFIIVFLFTIMNWYYVSIFCAVHQSSQSNWLVGVAISIGIGLIIPFLLCFISVFFRKKAVGTRNKRMFHFAKIIESMH